MQLHDTLDVLLLGPLINEQGSGVDNISSYVVGRMPDTMLVGRMPDTMLVKRMPDTMLLCTMLTSAITEINV